MKEFENWYIPDKDIYTNEYEMQKRAWQAALEMVLSASQCSGDSVDVFWDDIGMRWTPVGCDVRDVIREELNADKRQGKEG